MKTLRRCIIEAIQAVAHDPLNQARSRGLQALTHIRIIELLDQVILDAAQARISAPGALEAREWCLHALEELQAACTPDLNIQPDAVKDAMADTTLAARLGTGDAHKLALQRENELRKRAA